MPCARLGLCLTPPHGRSTGILGYWYEGGSGGVPVALHGRAGEGQGGSAAALPDTPPLPPAPARPPIRPPLPGRSTRPRGTPGPVKGHGGRTSHPPSGVPPELQLRRLRVGIGFKRLVLQQAFMLPCAMASGQHTPAAEMLLRSSRAPSCAVSRAALCCTPTSSALIFRPARAGDAARPARPATGLSGSSGSRTRSG